MSEFSKYFRDKGVFGKIILIQAIGFGLFLLALLPWWRPTWIYAVFFLVVGGEAFAVIFGIALVLLGFKLVSNPKDFSDSAKKVTRFLAALAFWFLMMAILFHDIPSETHFTKVLFVILVFIAIALGTYGGVLYFPWAVFRRFCTVQLAVALIIGLFAIKFPYQYERFKIWVSDKLSLSQPVSLIEMTSIADPEDFAFWDASGKPIRWYAKLSDGKFILASVPGYHGPTGVRLKPVGTAQQRQEIIDWIKANRAVKELAEQRSRVAETERIQRQQTAESLARAEQQGKQEEEKRQQLTEQRRKEAAESLARAEQQEKQEEEKRQQLTEQRRKEAAESVARAEQQIKQQEEKRQQLAKEREEYLARYIQKPAEKPDARIAVLVVTERQVVNESAAKSLETILGDHSYSATANFFTRAFLTDGLFEKSFGGSKGILDKLELANTLDAIVLGRESVYYVTNAALNGLITANLTLELSALSASTHQPISRFSVSAAGPGFKVEQARAVAEERALKQLATEPLDRLTRPLPHKR